MQKNRLNFDFTLETQQQRSDFLNFYFSHEPFLTNPPSMTELDKAADYVLWGKNPEGQNARQERLCDLNARSKTWNTPHETESLEQLIESPIFNEAEARPLTSTRYYTKASQQKFDRETTLTLLKGTPEFDSLSALLARIDKTDLLIDLWAYQNQKRETPPRAELLERFTPQQIREANQQASELTQFQWLKLRHDLVELRRQQFMFKDCADQHIRTNPYNLVTPTPQPPPDFDCEILTAPFSINNKLAFLPPSQLNPFNLSTADQSTLIHDYWTHQNELSKTSTYFDFKNTDHLYTAFQFFAELDTARDSGPENQTASFLKALNYYIDFADLNQIQSDVLAFKIKKIPNQKIADYLNQTYSKTYTPNYISTIFCQKIIPKIADAVARHEQQILNLPNPENFKKCTKCGTFLLKSKDNFTVKSRSSDGYTSICKKCDARRRAERKQEEQKLISKLK